MHNSQFVKVLNRWAIWSNQYIWAYFDWALSIVRKKHVWPPLKLRGCLFVHILSQFSQQNAKKQYLRVHWQNKTQKAWKIAQMCLAVFTFSNYGLGSASLRQPVHCKVSTFFIRLFGNIALVLCTGTTSGPLGDHLESGFRYICFVQLSDAFHAWRPYRHSVTALRRLN